VPAVGQEVPDVARAAPRDFVEIDLAGRITRVSPTYSELLGYPETELVGAELSAFESEQTGRDRLRAYVADLLAGRAASPYFAKQRARDGRTVPVRIDPEYHRDTSGVVTGLFLHVTRLPSRSRSRRGSSGGG
jgi:PAS domain S-box-containing protein